MASLTGMDELIGVINELQATFSRLQMKESDLNLNLPRIAVIGSQSSGKSSVLESFVGRDFLPRGSGIVTRCPLILQLLHLEPGNSEWGEFSHKPGQQYFDFEAIREEICAQTRVLAGDAMVCDKPILLKIMSPHVLSLTLIDLPGLIVAATKGQPESIVKAIEQMVLSHVMHDNTIILAVSSATDDLANSRALEVAMKVDREGKRTLGVLTKLDLMDQGTDALKILTGDVVRIRHGFVGVVNRSQKDINDNVKIEDARLHEKQFFLNHPAYCTVANRMGTHFLAKKLNQLLLTHIQACLPTLRTHVDHLLKSTRKKQEQLGMLEDTREPGALLLKMINAFTEAINKSISGDIEGVSLNSTNRELSGGARIDYIFYERFMPHIQSLRAGPMLSDDYLRMMIRTLQGLQPSLFPSDQVVLALIRQQLQRLEEPCLRCAQFVVEELNRIIRTSSSRIERFPILKNRAEEILLEHVHTDHTPCAGHIRTMVSAEIGFINVKHPAMTEALDSLRESAAQTGPGPQVTPGQPQHPAAPQSGKAVPAASSQKAPPPSIMSMNARSAPHSPGFEVPDRIVVTGDLTQREQVEHSSIRRMVDAYFSIAQGTICDQIPKVINLLLIAKLRSEMYHKLVHELYRPELINELLAESPDIAAQRKATTQMMKCLVAAQEVLQRVRDYSVR